MASYATHNDTNQCIQFDLATDDNNSTSSNTLYVGSTDGCVRQYDLASGKCTGTVAVTDGCAGGAVPVVNGVSQHTRGNSNNNGDVYLAVATGSRQFPSEDDLEHGTMSTEFTTGHLHLYKMTTTTTKVGESRDQDAG